MAYLDFQRESGLGAFARLCGAARRCAAVLDALPTDCPLCQDRAAGGGLCAGCLADVTRSMRGGRPRCAVCALPLGALPACPDCAPLAPAFDRVIAAFDYAAPGDLLIHGFKMEKRFAYARMLSGLLAEQIARSPPGLPGHTILVPVPSGGASIRRRGFNPAAEVARALARRMRLAYRPGVLRRVREGDKQASLGRAQRVRNARNMYACHGTVRGLHVAVVDDVLTTGSTVHGIALALKASGAASVSALVLARTPHRLAS